MERRKLHICINRDTFKYYMSDVEAKVAWKALSSTYGQLDVNPYFKIKEIKTDKFLIRSTYSGTPLTLILKKTCLPEDLVQFHEVIRFES